MPLDSYSTIVTGAAGAIGSALVRHLISLGGAVAAVDRMESAAGLHTLAAELGKRCLAVPADVGRSADWNAAITRIEKELGPIGYAALIAGGWRGGKALHAEADDQAWRAIFAMNLDTVHRSLRALLPGMVAREHGSIVVVGSRAVTRPWTSVGAAGYAASKAAVVTLAQTVAAEVQNRGVRVNAVLPSTVDTPANRSAMPDAEPSQWVSPESLSEVIAFLLSEGARDISGAAIPVYGRV